MKINVGVCCAILQLFLISCLPERELPASQVKNILLAEIDSLYETVADMKNDKRRDGRQKHFLRARVHYKKIESIVEFYYPGVSNVLNGPALTKTEEYDDKDIEPTGFQVVEELIFSSDTSLADTMEINQQLAILNSALGRLQKLIEGTTFTDGNIFEACRLQIVRVLSLGISGFDSPIAMLSMAEAEASLVGISTILTCYRNDTNQWSDLKVELEEAIRYLHTHTDFNTFNRAIFTQRYLNSIAEHILFFQQALKIPYNPWLGAIDMKKGSVFDEKAFQVAYFAPAFNQHPSDAVIELGRTLFFDPILSGNNSRACASCHQPQHAFTDGMQKSMAFNFEGTVSRNAPSLINSAFQKSQFWDQRVHFLEDQISTVISSTNEMHSDLGLAVEKLKTSNEYKLLFEKAFRLDTVTINQRLVQAALAAYIRSLTALNSRFDRFMRGDSSQLTLTEISGFNLFMGKAKCGTCHFAPLFSGTVPPLYTETEAEVLGVPSEADTANAKIDGDEGKLKAYNRYLYRYSFKTPTVRNSSLTAPYMHNGVYETLDQVIDFYDRGGGKGIGIELANQTLPPDRLNLTNLEKKALIAFIESLTDTTNTLSKPSRLPKMASSELNHRPIGGVY